MDRMDMIMIWTFLATFCCLSNSYHLRQEALLTAQVQSIRDLLSVPVAPDVTTMSPRDLEVFMEHGECGTAPPEVPAGMALGFCPATIRQE